MIETIECDACKDDGYLTISVDGFTAPDGMTLIQRCDQCERFRDDLEAAQAAHPGSILAVLCRKAITKTS